MAITSLTTTQINKFKSDNVQLKVNGTVGKSGTAINIKDTLLFEALEGYKFETAPKLIGSSNRVWTFTLVTESQYTLTAPDMATAGGFKSFEAVGVSNTEPKPLRYTFIAEDIELFEEQSVVATVDGVAVVVGTEIREDGVFKLVAKSGYTFTTAKILTDLGLNSQMTLNDSKTIATFTASTDSFMQIFVATERTQFLAFTFTSAFLSTLSTKGIQATVNDEVATDGTTIYSGDTFKFTVTKSDSILSFASFTYGSTNATQMMSISADQLSTTHTWNTQAVINAFTLTVSEKPSTDVVVYTFSDSDFIDFTKGHVTCYVNGATVSVGDKILQGDLVKLVCEPDYEFLIGQPVLLVSSIVVRLEIGDNRKSAEGYYNQDLEIYNFQFDTTKTSTVDSDTTNNTYEIKPRDLRNLESQSMKEWTSEGNLDVDYSNMIVGVMRYPFAIPEENVVGEGGIYLGHKQFPEVVATELNVDMLEIDLGTISVEGTYGDLRDYANTEALLRLPHLESTSLDLEYVIGQTIGVKYLVNLINGETVVIVSSTKLKDGSNTLLTLNATLGTAIPVAFKDGFNYKPTDSNSLRLGGENYIQSPTIDIVRNDQVNSDSPFNIPVKDSGKLTDFKGWTKIDDITLTLNATQQEKQEIISLLKSGVFFNVD